MSERRNNEGEGERMSRYYIGSSGDTMWHHTRATTVRGAKQIASRMYSPSVGGVIRVAVAGRTDVSGGSGEIVPVAVRHGFGAWVNG